jgi:transcription-repair coupling factor (superfamily II helicase)
MYTHNSLVSFLRNHGYRESPDMLQSGDFWVLGDTVRVWPVDSRVEVSFVFFGEEIESICPTYGQLPANQITTPHGPISPGAYCVHPHHGVGIFTRKSLPDADQDNQLYSVLQYADGDTLWFPDRRSDELMPYIGGRHPRLTRLYSQSWKRIRERVEKDVQGIARTLLQTYSTRMQARRVPYPVNDEWQAVVAGNAGISLTPDQITVNQAITDDLSHNRPMDRLICGDVGFGKTELAVRAAIRVLAAGKQVIVLAPTTILCEQHYALFAKRYAQLPVRVQRVSRFTTSQNSSVIEQFSQGQVDIVIGTHAILHESLNTSNLGLLIIDEEQKFGVEHKEWIRKKSPSCDLLCLSATPIPRTLSLSLSGVRDLSTIQTAPPGRLAVDTLVQPYDDTTLLAALQRELARKGQVYLVHYRVRPISHLLQHLVRLLEQAGHQVFQGDPDLAPPNAVVVGVAHGALPEDKLAQTMQRFMAGRVDILISSSIVEYGLDSPQANTLIVLHAETYGLADLYQLRGRVGRRNQQAHALFFLGGLLQGKQKSDLLPKANKRITALQEADSLGSGWSLALRDLEIRGGGNVLGNEQSGNLEAIGLLLYSALLKEAVNQQALQLGHHLFS